MAEKEGKKVFFVYPHSVFQENLIQRLVDLEFEIYILKSHEFVKPVLSKYPDSVFFLNIDTGLTREQWESFVRGLISSQKGSPVSLGVLSYEFDRAMAEVYLMELAIPCGYILLKQKLGDAANIITKTLMANEVKGRRKFVRFQAGEDSTLKLNAEIDGEIQNGTGLDISSAGMALVFDRPDVVIKKNTLISDIQLNLSGKRVRVSGVVIGYRKDDALGKYIFVVLFDKRVGPDIRGVIRNYVRNQLQAVMMKEFGIS